MAKKDEKLKTKSPKKERERITIYLDVDVINYFKTRANQPNAAAYQTQINSELRRIMDAESQAREEGMSEIEEKLLNSKLFLKVLKEKLDKI